MRIHKQRLGILVVALVGILGCFIPVGRVPLVWSLHGLQIARNVALGVFGLSVALALLGHLGKEMDLRLQIAGASAAGLVVVFCIFRFIVLGTHSLPNFEEDDPRAAVYYRKACDAGVMEACSRLGGCYWTGTCGLATDGHRGFELYEKACDGGDLNACGQLGVCYEFGGCGMVKSGERAVALYDKACSGGDSSMCNNLGVCYHKGECGLAKDDTRAAQLYRKACKGGDSSACHNLAVMKN
ncbi:MAG TPA: tetratricopeptide repeat protein [Polyangia bacterium]